MIFVNLVARILAATVVSFVLSLLVGDASSSWDNSYRDVLVRVRDPVPVSRELLLVAGSIPVQPESGDDPGPVELMWLLAELGAERVLLPASWLPADLSATGGSESDSKVTSRLDEEFTRIDENIAELFNAIRIGSVEPSEAERFIEHLRQLVADSKARIQEGLSRKSGSSGVSAENVIDAFGSDRVAMELSDLGVSLPSYPSAVAIPIPPSEKSEDQQFRRLPFSSIRRYVAQANRFIARLSRLEEAGYFDEADPRNQPSIMRDHLRSLRTELYEEPTESRLAAWRHSVDRYFEAVGGLIDADMQHRLIERLETLEATENLDDDSATQIRAMKQELETTFATVRQEYAELIALRKELSQAVEESFVILEDEPVPTGGVSEVERRAVTANSVLVGEHLYVPTGWNRTFLLTAVGLLIGIILAPFRAVIAVALSPAAFVLGAAVCAALFVVSDIWIAPVAVVTVTVGATGAVIVATGFSQGRVKRTLAGRAVDRLPWKRMSRTMLRGGLSKNETGRRRAAIVAVAPEVTGENRPAVLRSFHRAISRKITKRGGIVFGEEGLTVFAAFDTMQPGNDIGLAEHACAAVHELVLATFPAGTSVRCGVEVGDVVFYVSPIGGYRATGPTVTYARRLSQLARKYHHHALFGNSVITACGDDEAVGNPRHFQEQGKLAVSTTGDQYAFFSLTEIDRPAP
ncbi:MAG: hypothetical protein WD492_14825 [Alkalispirochaeta sp.]